MSITGVGLTYERQLIAMAERSDYPVVASDVQPLSLTQLTVIAQQYPTKKTAVIALKREPNALVQVKDGRRTVAYLNPYTGEKAEAPGAGTKAFLGKLRAFHRWLTLDGSFSEAGRWVNGVSNVIFIILILSGLYLWLPKRFTHRAFRKQLTLSGNYPNASARHYQWHNVFGIYMAPALFVVAFTAIFFSFKWPGQTLKEYASLEGKEVAIPVALAPALASQQLTLDQQLAATSKLFPQWQSIRFDLPSSAMATAVFNVDNGNGGEPQKRVTIALDTLTGKVVEQRTFEQMSEYRKARSYIRFLHTGEVFGLTGQTLAGIASLLACFLVYTGSMLSWRRWKNRNKK